MCVSALLELHEAPSVECFATTITSPSGKYMANFDVKESKWRVTTVKPKKQIAKKKLREDAVKDLEQLEAGVHKWQKKQTTAAVVEHMERFDSNQKLLPGRVARPVFDTGISRGPPHKDSWIRSCRSAAIVKANWSTSSNED